MKEISSLVESRGGIVTKADLVALGATDHHLTRAVRSGSVSRVRRGWYSTLPKNDPRVVAVAVGGRLTGASALHVLGAWMWSTPPIEIAVPHNASRLRPRPRGSRVYWTDDEVSRQKGGRGTVDVEQALVHAVPRVPFEEAVALLDWAVRSGLVDRMAFAGVISRLPRRSQRIEEYVDSSAGSFPESIIRTRLRMNGRRVATQVSVGDLQRIDIVVDDVVAIEFDGRAWHADSFEADRQKDLRILSDGRVALRLSYGMVRRAWEAVVAAVDAALAFHREASPQRRARRRGSRRARGLVGVPWSLPRYRRKSERRGMRHSSERLARS
jgi:very-short-patch-repair endonuclease